MADSAFTSALGIITGRMTFIKIDPTYTELVTSGNIDIIREEQLKKDLVIYFKGLEKVEQIINKNNQHFTDDHFLKTVLTLSEIQVTFNHKIGTYFIDKIKKQGTIDLNEDRLKELTRMQLKKPENELLMINLINFRHFLALAHIDFMNDQKEKTLGLIKQIAKR
ncbi:MAG: hypothetical protein RIA69_10645 [Cyclobacteriaceae bacterium]